MSNDIEENTVRFPHISGLNSPGRLNNEEREKTVEIQREFDDDEFGHIAVGKVARIVRSTERLGWEIGEWLDGESFAPGEVRVDFDRSDSNDESVFDGLEQLLINRTKADDKITGATETEMSSDAEGRSSGFGIDVGLDMGPIGKLVNLDPLLDISGSRNTTSSSSRARGQLEEQRSRATQAADSSRTDRTTESRQFGDRRQYGSLRVRRNPSLTSTMTLATFSVSEQWQSTVVEEKVDYALFVEPEQAHERFKQGELETTRGQTLRDAVAQLGLSPMDEPTGPYTWTVNSVIVDYEISIDDRDGELKINVEFDGTDAISETVDTGFAGQFAVTIPAPDIHPEEWTGLTAAYSSDSDSAVPVLIKSVQLLDANQSVRLQATFSGRLTNIRTDKARELPRNEFEIRRLWGPQEYDLQVLDLINREPELFRGILEAGSPSVSTDRLEELNQIVSKVQGTGWGLATPISPIGVRGNLIGFLLAAPEGKGPAAKEPATEQFAYEASGSVTLPLMIPLGLSPDQVDFTTVTVDDEVLKQLLAPRKDQAPAKVEDPKVSKKQDPTKESTEVAGDTNGTTPSAEPATTGSDQSLALLTEVSKLASSTAKLAEALIAKVEPNNTPGTKDEQDSTSSAKDDPGPATSVPENE